MTKYVPALVLAVLAGCPTDDDKNAETVWLAPDGVETRVKLNEKPPPPF